MLSMLRKKENKILTIFVVLAMILALSLTACSADKTEPPAEPSGEASANKDVLLATTTSTMDTGLLDVLIPMFEEKTGYIVKPNAVGTGQALKMGEMGNVDVLLVHAPEAEMELVNSGVAINRQLVMHNDFVFVGPTDDPAGIKGTATSVEALKKIADKEALFVSRGDDSGTHKMEKKLWQAAGIEPQGGWYQETGRGMGDTLNVASEKGGYALTDRGTYLAQQKNLSLDIMVEGEKALLNIYHVMEVNAEKFPDQTINSEGAQAFIEFMVSSEAQEVIDEFGVDKYGQPLFFPDAGKDENTLGQ